MLQFFVTLALVCLVLLIALANAGRYGAAMVPGACFLGIMLLCLLFRRGQPALQEAEGSR